MEPSIDYDHPDSIPAAERAISLQGQTVTAHPHGWTNSAAISGRVVGWEYEAGWPVVWVDGPRGPEAVYQQDARPV
jgi:hypothetical protein